MMMRVIFVTKDRGPNTPLMLVMVPDNGISLIYNRDVY